MHYIYIALHTKKTIMVPVFGLAAVAAPCTCPMFLYVVFLFCHISSDISWWCLCYLDIQVTSLSHQSMYEKKKHLVAGRAISRPPSVCLSSLFWIPVPVLSPEQKPGGKKNWRILARRGHRTAAQVRRKSAQWKGFLCLRGEERSYLVPVPLQHAKNASLLPLDRFSPHSEWTINWIGNMPGDTGWSHSPLSSYNPTAPQLGTLGGNVAKPVVLLPRHPH